jgi:hypothetical protein
MAARIFSELKMKDYKCELITEYAKRKVWGLIGLYSNKGPEWGNMGRSFIKAILNSARGFSENDNSPAAQNARKINGIGDLDGIEFSVFECPKYINKIAIVDGVPH